MKKEKKQWEVPEIITYSEDEILKAIGPAQTLYPVLVHLIRDKLNLF